MCGIIGYVGHRPALPLVLEGLERLSYRGYDSAGVALVTPGGLFLERAPGKIEVLKERLAGRGPDATLGVGHTRWATHGRPNEENAHPHTAGDIVLVHNGIIENFLALKHRLDHEGCAFRSETDTEVVVHLVRQHYRGDLPQAVREAVRELRGSFALVVMSALDPDLLVAVRHESPLVVGLGKGESFVASDIPAFLKETREALILENGQMALIRREGVLVTDFLGAPLAARPVTVTWDALTAEKGGYKHFMLKEIVEQRSTVLDTFRGRIDPEEARVFADGFDLTAEAARSLGRVVLVACGTSFYAGQVAEYFLEELLRLPVEVEIASEFRYRQPVMGGDTLMVAISQSGETADTLAAVREARRQGSAVISVCNVLGSSLARDSDGVIYTHAGPEIGVASTKAFTAQITALYLMALRLGILRESVARGTVTEALDALVALPGKLEEVLRLAPTLARLARKFYRKEHFLYLGRGISFPVAMEGALKLKEISYIHAEGYAGGEMKHGPIALVDENMPVVALVPRDEHREKILSNIREVRARDGVVIGVGNPGDDELASLSQELVTVPETHRHLSPILTVVPLQLLAYHIADRRGNDVDQPRNLAKSVTVE
jgi:glucosamine--fructose-6-phosphate aminotransferase (isomerizing)